MSNPTTASRVLGVVLAGGRSRRMGRDKAELAWVDGRTFLNRAVTTMGRLVDQVAVVGRAPARGRTLDSTDGSMDGSRVNWLDDAGADPGASSSSRGPLAGIEAALVELERRRPLTHALVHSCDAPLTQPDDFRPFLRLLEQSDFSLGGVAFVDDQGRPVPLPCLLSASTLRTLQRQRTRGDESVRGLLGAVDVALLLPEHGVLGRLRGFNTPEELQAARGD